MVPTPERPKLSPQTEVWPPAHIVDMPTTIGSRGYVFMMSFLHFVPFLPLFLAVTHFFQLNSCGCIMGSAKTQPTD